MSINQNHDSPIFLIKQRASYFDEDLNEEEKDFLWLVSVGDVDGLKTLMQENAGLDTECCDFRGQRALDIAVSRHDVPLVEFLLDRLKVSPVHFYCAILRAVLEKDVDILEMLLDRAEGDCKLHLRLSDLMVGDSNCSNCLPEVATTNLTPTMTAAINGDLEITRLLLERGYCILKPHTPKCHCPDHCVRNTSGYETLTQSIARINAFKALASPCYLILTSEDPILSAFQLSRELQHLSIELPENQKDYSELVKQCSRFAADLLNECRNTEEVQTVLVQRKGFNDPRPHKFSRLHLAVQCNQREFVTHPSCQQVLRSMWVDGLGGWYGWSFRWRAYHVIKHTILTPFVSLAYIFIPKPEMLGPLRVPLNRFIYSATSYLLFLSLLMVTLLNDRRYDVNSPLTWTESAVCLYVVGHSWGIVSNLFSVGIRSYFRSLWSVFDLVMFSLFLVTDLLWFSVFISREVGGSELPSNRMTWSWYHPVLLGEGLYATASVMAFSRLLMWCHVHSKLGPLGTSIKYMLGDVARFFVLFFIIMFAFATGINSIYKNYKDATLIESDGKVVEQPDAFLTLKNTFKSLFWAIFGMGEPDFAQVIITRNLSGADSTDDGIIAWENHHLFTEGVGYGLWGLYHMVTVIVLLNMLIAMMAESYQRVQLNADLEWKFACSMLWLTVFDSHSVVPVPFNLIPSMHRLTFLCRWCIACVQGSLGRRSGKIACSKNRCCYWDPEVDLCSRKAEEDKYEKLMVQLIRRYLHCKEQNESSAATTSFSFAELREKLKFEILQDLSRSYTVPRRTFTRRRTRKESRNKSQRRNFLAPNLEL